METELSRQSLALLAALLMGVGIGVVYDMLRPVRRRTGRLAGAALDILFCAASGCAAFFYAMGAGDGRLGLWELAAALVGFLLYMHTLSECLLRLFTALLDALCAAVLAVKKFLGKVLLLTRNFLGKVRQWLRKLRDRFKKKATGEEES